MKKRIAFLLLAICFIISGCAFGTRRPILKYTIGTISKPQNNINIFVDTFIDDRLDKEVIGHVRNGYGMKTAKVVTVTSISDWVSEAMKAELQNSGYTVTTDPNTNNIVEGEVIKVYCDSYMTYDGEVGIEVTLKKNGEEIFSRKYLGKDESINMACRAKSYGITLERCLQKALVDAVHDIDREFGN